VSVIEEVRTMEASSTEKRIDDLSGRVGRFEERVDARFDRFEDKVDARFDKVDARFERLEDGTDARFNRIESKIDLTNRTIWGGIFAAAMIKILFG
jgi:hypothetical protein